MAVLKNERARVLRERARDSHALPLAAGQFLRRSIRERAHFGVFDRPSDGRRASWIHRAPEMSVRMTAEGDVIRDAQRERGLLSLRHDRHAPGQRSAIERADVLTVHRDDAALQRHSA